MNLSSIVSRLKHRMGSCSCFAIRRKKKNPIDQGKDTPWHKCEYQNFQVRAYNNYDIYIQHQKAKLDRVLSSTNSSWLSEYDVNYRNELRTRLNSNGHIDPGMSILCLAARMGTEVKSFLDLGCFAVGLDLNPGHENKWVVYGDFHDVQFSTDSVDVVFTNSLDHIFDIERVIDEIKRVLKRNGLLIVEAVRGSEEGVDPGSHESFWWSKIDDIVDLFRDKQFELIGRESFEFPWSGEHLCFKKVEV